MAKYSAFERIFIFTGALLQSLPKVLTAWFFSIVMVVGSIYLFREESYIWGSVLSLLTLGQILLISIAVTVGFIEGLYEAFMKLKYEDKPE